MSVIMISGKAESGKDFTASILKEELEKKGRKILIVHYADYLKFIAKEYFGWDGVKDEKGRNIFAYRKRSSSVEVVVDVKLGKQLTDELAQKAMDVCPVGSILVKEKGFVIPIGERKYDNLPIGSDIENMQVSKI